MKTRIKLISTVYVLKRKKIKVKVTLLTMMIQLTIKKWIIILFKVLTIQVKNIVNKKIS